MTETAATARPGPTRQMVDSAYPLAHPPKADIILIYAGGDTPHPWTRAEILAMPARYRWPCWVRSDPGQVNVLLDAALFAAWLHGHQVPMGTCVILDLETAVDTAYVNVFNLALRAAGFRVTKYGSESSIWQNPKTDGGTFVAQPGPNVLTTEGDTVARQYAFDGGFDLSVVKGQRDLPLWDTAPDPDPAPRPAGPVEHTTAGQMSLAELAAQHHTTPAAILDETMARGPDQPALAEYVNAAFGQRTAPHMPAGLKLWLP